MKFLLLLTSLCFANDFYSLDIKSTINPGTLTYIDHGIKTAYENKAQGLIIKLNTPGGLLSATRDIISSFSTSEIPIIVYVSPVGASATSAGAFILIGSHLALMNKGTNVGASSPVSGDGAKMGETIAKKAMNDTKAFMRSIAVDRGKNELEAENFVSQASSLTAEEALKKNIIDLVIEDPSKLLESIHNQTIKFKNKEVTFDTKKSKIIEIKPRLLDSFLTIIAHPQIAYLLLMAGMIGLYVELTHPGVVIPGIAGAICLILGFISLQTMPVSIGFLLLMILGIALMIAEIFVASFGALGIGGLISFIIGSLYLFEDPSLKVPLGLILASSLSIAFIIFFIGIVVIKGRRHKSVDYGIVGKTGHALEDFTSSGFVLVDGERWMVQSNSPIQKNDKVRITKQISLNEIEVEKV